MCECACTRERERNKECFAAREFEDAKKFHSLMTNKQTSKLSPKVQIENKSSHIEGHAKSYSSIRGWFGGCQNVME